MLSQVHDRVARSIEAFDVIVGVPVVEPFLPIHPAAKAIAPASVQFSGRLTVGIGTRARHRCGPSIPALNASTRLTRSTHGLKGSSKVTRTCPFLSVGSLLIRASSFCGSISLQKSLFCVFRCSADDHHRYLSVGQHAMAHTAQKQARQCTVTPGAHHN